LEFDKENNKLINKEELKTFLVQMFNLDCDDDEFDKKFSKIDFRRNGIIDRYEMLEFIKYIKY